MKKRKYKGKLAKKIDARIVGLLDSEEIIDAKLQAWEGEDWEKILLLCEELNVATDDHMWPNLVIALAREYVPGFQTKTRPGRKTKWTDSRIGLLVVETERLSRMLECTIEVAADELAKRKPWCDFLEIKEKGPLAETTHDPGEALRKKYYESKNSLWARTCKDAYLLHEIQGRIDEWDAELIESLVD
jgi:hypothetical protein